MRLAALLMLLTVPAFGQVDGGSPDAPMITRLTNDQYMVNAAAFNQIDNEVKRLQTVEAEHKGESWISVIAIGMVVGLVVGIPVGIYIGRATVPTPKS